MLVIVMLSLREVGGGGGVGAHCVPEGTTGIDTVPVRTIATLSVINSLPIVMKLSLTILGSVKRDSGRVKRDRDRGRGSLSLYPVDVLSRSEMP